MIRGQPADMPFFSAYHDAFKVSASLQFCVLLLASLMLDGGEFLQFVLLAAAAYWFAVGIIMLRRDGCATRVDRLMLKWGFPLMIVLAGVVGAMVPVGLLRHI